MVLLKRRKKSGVQFYNNFANRPLQPQWPQQPPQPNFIKEFPDPDGWIILGTKMTNTGPFLWNGSSKIHFFTDI